MRKGNGARMPQLPLRLRGLTGAQYWGRETAATVGHLTTTAGALVAGYAENLLMGTAFGTPRCPSCPGLFLARC